MRENLYLVLPWVVLAFVIIFTFFDVIKGRQEREKELNDRVSGLLDRYDKAIREAQKESSAGRKELPSSFETVELQKMKDAKAELEAANKVLMDVVAELEATKNKVLMDAELDLETAKDKVLADAEVEFEVERNKIRNEFRKQISELAIEGAEKILQRTKPDESGQSEDVAKATFKK